MIHDGGIDLVWHHLSFDCDAGSVGHVADAHGVFLSGIDLFTGGLGLCDGGRRANSGNRYCDHCSEEFRHRACLSI